MLEFYISDEQEKKLNKWLNQLKNEPKAHNKPLKYIFYSSGGIGQVQEVTKVHLN
jgi:hypothetical protein